MENNQPPVKFTYSTNSTPPYPTQHSIHIYFNSGLEKIKTFPSRHRENMGGGDEEQKHDTLNFSPPEKAQPEFFSSRMSLVAEKHINNLSLVLYTPFLPNGILTASEWSIAYSRR